MSFRRSLSPNQKFSIIVASLAVLVAAETGGLFVLTQDMPAPVEAVPTPNLLNTTEGEPALPTKPSAPAAPPPQVFTVPGAEPNAPTEGLPTQNSAVALGPARPGKLPLGSSAANPLASAPESKNNLAAADPAQAKESPQKAQARLAFIAGVEALKKNDKATALKSFESVTRMVPDNLPSRLNLASLYLEARQPNKALPHLQKAAQIDPKSAAVRFNLARTFLALRRPKDALVPLRETVKLAPNEREGHVLLAQILMQTRQEKEAYAQWTFLAGRDKSDVLAHLTAAAIANDVLNQPKAAEKWLRQGIQGAPRAPQPPLMLGRLLLSRGQAKAAIPVLTAATKARPDVFEFYPMLAQARAATGDSQGAVNAIQSAIMRLPVGKTAEQKARIAFAEGELRITLGQTLGNDKKIKPALAEFQKAAQLRPNDAQPRSLAAVALLQIKDEAGAMRMLQDALRIDPKRANDRRLLAETYIDAKRWKEADTQLELYARAQPRDIETLLRWSQVAKAEKDGNKEAQILGKITQNAPNNPLGWAQLGILQRDAGNKKAALAAFTKLALLRPTDPSPPFEMARLQSALGDKNAAFAAWQKVVRNKPAFAPAYSSLLQAGDEAGERSAARAFLVRQMSGRTENVGALKEVLSFYDDKKRPDEAKAFLNDLVARNPKFQAAKAALDSFAAAKETPAKPTEAPTGPGKTNG